MSFVPFSFCLQEPLLLESNRDQPNEQVENRIKDCDMYLVVMIFNNKHELCISVYWVILAFHLTPRWC